MKGSPQGNRQCVVLFDGNDLKGVVPSASAEKHLYPEPLCTLHWHPACHKLIISIISLDIIE